MDERLQPLLEANPGWLDRNAPLGDVVVASRVRLARNVADRPFPQQLGKEEAEGLQQKAEQALGQNQHGDFLAPQSLTATDAEFLLERSLVTRDLLACDRPTRVWFGPTGDRGVMLLEEDHFRIQGFAPGLDLERALELAQQQERHLRGSFPFAVSDRYGFLTSCPSNTGSGMRASLMLHLPALARAKAPVQRALHAARSASLAVRGVHGEGSQALGFFYQISNQRTLGETMAAQMAVVAEYGREVVAFETTTRERFGSDPEMRQQLQNDADKAVERLAKVRELTSAQALEALSTIRLATLLEMDCGVKQDAFGLMCLCFRLQPGHLQAQLGCEMNPEDRDLARASWLRSELGLEA